MLRDRARRVAERLLGGDSAAVRADRDVGEAEAAARPLALFGGPVQNAWTARLAPALPVRPWEEDDGALDLEAQRACYEAFAAAADRRTWLAGVLWWKWYSSDRIGGARDGSFTPRGKPAEEVLRRALAGWRGRPVVPPRGAPVSGRPR